MKRDANSELRIANGELKSELALLGLTPKPPIRTPPTRAGLPGLALACRVLLGALVLVTVAGYQNLPKQASREAAQRWNQARAGVKAKLASDQLAAGDIPGAASELAEAERLTPGEARLAPLRARVYLAQGNVGAARALLESARLTGKPQAEVEYLLGVVQQGQEAWEASLTHYLRAAELDAEVAAYHVAAVQVMLQLGRAAEALQYLQARESQLGWTSAYSAASAECYEQVGNWRAAALAWQRVVDGAESGTTSEPQVFARGADVSNSAPPGSDPRGADPGMNAGARENGAQTRTAAGIRERWATALHHAGQWADAIPILQTLLLTNETDSPAALRLMLADCYLQVNDLTEAREQVTRVLDGNVQEVRALRLLAQTLAREGQYAEALAAAERALGIAPEHVPTMELAAALAARCGRVELARALATRLMQSGSDGRVEGSSKLDDAPRFSSGSDSLVARRILEGPPKSK
jgi:tetratricopeptide (TPR) repeat protein